MTPTFLKKNYILSHFTPRLAAAVSLIALSSLNYGFDNQGLATSQAMSTYKHQFGEWDSKKSAWAIPTYWTSLLNSLNFIGFAFGARPRPESIVLPQSFSIPFHKSPCVCFRAVSLIV